MTQSRWDWGRCAHARASVSWAAAGTRNSPDSSFGNSASRSAASVRDVVASEFIIWEIQLRFLAPNHEQISLLALRPVYQWDAPFFRPLDVEDDLPRVRFDFVDG